MNEQYAVDLNPRSQSGLQDIRQKTLAGSKYALLIAGLALLSFVFILLTSIVFNIFHLFHTPGVLTHIHELEVSPSAMLSLRFIGPCVGVFAVCLAIRWSREPIHILRYLRQIKREEAQKHYAELYIPLKALPADPTHTTFLSRATLSQEPELMAWALQQQDRHLLLLGPRGSGKTMFLHVYQSFLLRHFWKIIVGRQKIPVFVSMETYNNFLNDELIDFLQKRVRETRHLRRYIQKMASKGRLALLCDGINEISANELDALCGHLLGLMDETGNQLILTCRQIEYFEHPYIQELVTETGGKTAFASLDALPQEQVEPFVHRYMEQQGNTWRHSADKIFQVIQKARLLSLCINPSSLLTLMQIIDQVGREGEHGTGTRGLFVQEFVSRKIDSELQDEWKDAGFTRDDVLRFLSELAYIMRWASDRNELRLSLPLEEGPLDYEVLAEELLDWLGAQQAQGLFVADQGNLPGLFHDSLHKRKRIRLLQFARSIQFISIHPEGELSFERNLIASYFVAQYLYFLKEDSEWQTLVPLNAAFLSEEAIERWREPFALWAGLVSDPAPFIARIVLVGQRDQQYAASALMLSLVCLGAKRHPQQGVQLPPGVQQMVVNAAADKNTRRKMARVIDRYATETENGSWVYRALLPLLAAPGVERLMMLLNNQIVPELLFQHLAQITNNIRDSSRREPLIRILQHFASQKCEDVIRIAAQLSQPASQRNPQLRKAAIDILGYTQDKRVIKPLLLLLQDTQSEFVYVISSALARLGPSLTLEPLIEELHHNGSRAAIPVLSILENFLTVQHQEFQLKDVEYQRVLEELVPVLSSNYLPEVQECACDLLKKLIQRAVNETEQRQEKIVVLLLEQLESEDKALGNHVVELLKEVGEVATPDLLSRLQPGLSATGRRRIVEVLSRVRDQRALDALLSLVADEEVFHRVKFALQHYASQYPECINRLIALVLDHPDEKVAKRAAEILGDIGGVVVDPVINALPSIEFGRTEELVGVLVKVHDQRAIRALIDLLTMPQVRHNTHLALIVIRDLGEFRDQSVVPPLLNILASPHTQLIDEVIDVLSNLGEIAFRQLVDALTVQQEIGIKAYLRQALIHMKSPLDQKAFRVDEELVRIFSTCNEELAEQIRLIFRDRGVGAAQELIRHITDPDSHIQNRVLVMVYAMEKSVVIPAFVTALRLPPSELAPELISHATQYLTQYDESILALVIALRDPQFEAISLILLEFGARLLHGNAMIVGLEDKQTKERLQDILKKLATRQPGVIAQIIDLFSLIKDNTNPLAYTALVDLLADDLAAQQSIHYLIEALEKPRVVDGVAGALQRLAGRFETQNEVINGLIQSLQSEKGHKGAKEALVRLGDKAVYPVGALIAHDDSFVAVAAQEILTRIGPSAFPVIWTALSDSDTRRQEAGRSILCAMPTNMIKDKLITLLLNDKATDIGLAVTLLFELIQNETRRLPGNQKMIPTLLASIEAKIPEHKKLRILTLLLLWGESNVAEFLLQKLCYAGDSQLDEQLAQAFLLLRKEIAGKALQDAMQDTTSALSPQLRAQLAGILGMIKPDLVSDDAGNIADYGLIDGGNGQMKNPYQLAVSLRALGALLANGSWNIQTLRRLREHAEAGTSQRELFDILLGDLYSPRIQRIVQQKEAETIQREAQERETRRLAGELGQAQQALQEINGTLQSTLGALAQAEAERDHWKAWGTQLQELMKKQQQASGTGGSSNGAVRF